MKYIDVEKLKAEIERRQEVNHRMADNAINSNMRNFYDGEEDCCKQLISLIESLQQEQKDILVLNKKDWEKQEQFRKDKKFGIPIQQEQPEVDLEKEIEEYFPESDFYTGWNYDDVTEVARDFWNKGYNARKEE